MKKLAIYFLIFLISFAIFSESGLRAAEESPRGIITISGAWALYPMAIRWKEEFCKLYPGIKIDIGAGGAGKGMADCLADIVDIGMVSRKIYPAEAHKGAWWVSVTKDAVLPTTNENNPFLGIIYSRGVNKDILKKIWIAGDIEDWGDILPEAGAHPMNIYTRSDACGAAETWAQYFGKNQEDLLGIGVYGDPGLAEAVKRDKFGIGFNNLNYIYDMNNKKFMKGIVVLPLDLDGNDRLDPDEDFYATRDDITNAISEGRYPSPPARDLFFVCHHKPEKRQVRLFINWVLTDGQLYVKEAGYIGLGEEKLKRELNKLEKDPSGKKLDDICQDIKR